MTGVYPHLDPDTTERTAMLRFHLEAVALQRQYPELLGPRLMSNCPHDHLGEPRSALAKFMRANTKAASCVVSRWLLPAARPTRRRGIDGPLDARRGRAHPLVRRIRAGRS